jgi:hypothetical protein
MLLDMFSMIWPVCEPKAKVYIVKNAQGDHFEHAYKNSWRRFSLMNYKHVVGQYSKRMLRSVNPLFFMRFVVSLIFVAVL